MGYYAYEGIPDKVLDQQHQTATGEHYTIRCSDSLRVEMPYVGKNHSNATSQGWLRSSSYYFSELQKSHPEMFSKANNARIQQGKPPIVDQKMLQHNPQWSDFRQQELVHHHVGGDGEVAAVPKGAHKGYGEIHNQEKNAGITEQCKQFSEKCDQHAQTNPKVQGQTSTQIRTDLGLSTGQKNSGTQQKDDLTKDTTQNSTVGRSDSVRQSIGATGEGHGRAPEQRADAVRSGVSAESAHRDSHAQSQSASSRSAAVFHGTEGSTSTFGGSSQSHSSGSAQSSDSSGGKGSDGHSSSGGGQSK